MARPWGSQVSPFERHDITHLSPSSLNLFVSAPAVWVLEKVLKRRQPVGCAAHRGTAVEDGITHGLTTGEDDAACVAVAERKFAQVSALSGDPNKDKEREAIPGFVAQGLAELRPYGKPSRMQGKIEYRADGLLVPIIGFFDYAWDDVGVLTDLKTTHALPSKIKGAHAKQVALYCAAMGDNLEARVTYATTKKAATYRVDNPREHVKALERIAFTVQRFLSVSNDPMELAGIVVPDVESFYLSDPAARAEAFRVWGL